MKEKWEVRKIDFGSRTMFQLKVGSNPNFIMWVSPKLVTQTENGYFIELPMQNVKVVQGRKDLILLPGSKNLFSVYVRHILDRWESGSESSISIDTCPCEIFTYESYANHRAALVLTEDPCVEYRWKKARRQTVKEGFGIIHLDGTVTEVDGEKEDALASLV